MLFIIWKGEVQNYLEFRCLSHVKMDINIENNTIKMGKAYGFLSIIFDSQGNNHSLIILITLHNFLIVFSVRISFLSM